MSIVRGKRLAACLTAATMFSLSGATAALAEPVKELDATLTIGWETQNGDVPTELTSDQVVSAQTEWDLNYPHGVVDPIAPHVHTINFETVHASFTEIPSVCDQQTSTLTEAGTKLKCDLAISNDDGVQGTIPTPVRATGKVGDLIKITATDAHGNSVSTSEIKIVGTSYFDVALAPSLQNITGRDTAMQRDPNTVTESHLPVVIFQPWAGENLAGETKFDIKFDVNTKKYPGWLDSLVEDVKAVPIPENFGIRGVPYNSDDFPMPDVKVVKKNKTTISVTVTVPTPPVANPPEKDGFNNALLDRPVASFALQFRNKLYSDVLQNTGYTVRANILNATAETEGHATLSIQKFTDNDSSARSWSVTGRFSSYFAGRCPNTAPDGSVTIWRGRKLFNFNPLDEWLPSFNENTGSGTQVTAACNWSGTGPIMADEQVPTRTTLLLESAKRGDYQPGEKFGLCVVYDPATTGFNGKTYFMGLSDEDAAAGNIKYEYLTGAPAGNLNKPDCSKGSWSATPPADLSKVTGVRAIVTPSELTNDLWTTRVALITGTYPKASGGVMWSAGSWFEDKTSTPNWVVQDDAACLPGVEVGGKYGHPCHGWRDAMVITQSRTMITIADPEQAYSPGDVIDLTVTSTVANPDNKPTGTRENTTSTLTLPKGFEYVTGSNPLNPRVSVNPKGEQVLTWDQDIELGTAVDNVFSVRNVGEAVGTRKVSTTIVNNDSTNANKGDSFTIITIIDRSGASLEKTVAASEFAEDGKNTWFISLRNRSSNVLPVSDTIDVLPFDGDGRGTKTTSTTKVESVTVEGMADSTDIYFATADPATISYDPIDPANGSLGEPSSMWVKQSGSTIPDGVTAIRWVSKNIQIGGTVEYKIGYAAEGSTNGDKLVNSAQTRTHLANTEMINSEVTTSIAPPAKLQVDKAFKPTPGVSLTTGSKIEFTITVKGNGPGMVRDAALVDYPVEGLSDVKFKNVSAGTVSEAGDAWFVGDIPVGETRTATVEATVSGTDVTKVLNQVVGDTGVTEGEDDVHEQITQRGSEDCVANEGVEADTDQCDVVELTEQSVLKVDKSFTNPTDPLPLGGGEASFTVTVKNAAEEAEGVITTAANVKATDVAGDAFEPGTVKFSNPSKGSVSGADWEIGELAAGETVTATVTGTLKADVEAAGFVNGVFVTNPTNVKTLTNPDEAVENDGVDADTDQTDKVVVKYPPRLVLNKELISSGNHMVDYKLETKNVGGADAHNVVLSDVFGVGYKNFWLLEPTAGSIANNELKVDVLKPGETVSVTVRVLVAENLSEFDNWALVTSDETPNKIERDPSGNITGDCQINPDLETDTDMCDKVSIELPLPQLVILKTNPTHDANRLVTFDVQVANIGQSMARDVDVKDIPDLENFESVQFVSADKGTVDGLTWTIGDLAFGQRASAKVEAQMKPGSTEGVNTVTVGSPVFPHKTDGACQDNDTLESDTDRCDLVGVTVPKPVLRVNKTVSQQLPDGTVVYQLEVFNDSEINASNVVVKDLPGEGLSDVEITENSLGVISNGTVWDIGDLTAGQTATAVVTGRTTPGGETVTNTVTVENPELPVDSTNCVPNETVSDDLDQCDLVTVTPVSPDLGVAKTLNDVDENNQAKFTVEVVNRGDGNATSVVVTDIPHTDLVDMVLDNTSKGTIDGLVVNIGDLAPGESVTITGSGKVKPGVIEADNTVVVGSVEQPAPTGESCEHNETATEDTDQCDNVMIQFKNAEMKLVKTLENVNRETAEFTIRTCNVGEATAIDARIVDLGGTGIESLTSTDPRFVDNAFQLGDVTPGECVAVAVTAKITGSGTNAAYVDTPSDPYDPTSTVPNDTLEADTDGYDRVEFTRPPKPPVPAVSYPATKSDRLPPTGAPGTLPLSLTALTLLTTGVYLTRRRKLTTH